MNPPSPDPSEFPLAAPPAAFDSPPGFQAALVSTVERAIAAGTRRLTLVDRDFAGWALDDPRLHAALTGWLRLPGRRLVLVAAGYLEVEREFPRFIAWRRFWSHAVDAWVPVPELAAELPTLLLDDSGWVLHVVDPMQWRGRAGRDMHLVRQWRERIDALLQRCERAFPVSCTGL
jgi:hypothetical protein